MWHFVGLYYEDGGYGSGSGVRFCISLWGGGRRGVFMFGFLARRWRGWCRNLFILFY